MRGFIKKIIFAIGILSLMLPVLVSCHGTVAHVKKVPKKIHLKIPYESFVHINITKVVKPGYCFENNEDMVGCQKILEKLPDVPTGGTGSGMVISHKSKIYVLTAAHVCALAGNFPTEAEYENFKFSLTVDSEISLSLYEGKVYKSKIIAQESKTDLCLLEAPKKLDGIKPVYLSRIPPSRGDKVFNVAAPMGIVGKNLTLIFSGYYSGHHQGWQYYTFVARPGSSGSLVLNEKYQVIGMVNVAMTKIESVAVGASWWSLKKFLNKNIPK